MSQVQYDISVLIPVSEARHDDLCQIFHEHKRILEEQKNSFEFIFIFDAQHFKQEEQLLTLANANKEQIKIIKFHRFQGEARALAAGFTKASGRLILTLPAYFQIQPQEIKKLFQNFNREIDVLVGRRFPRRDNIINRLQAKLFHKLINQFTNESFHDISCGVRLMRREVLEGINLYGDLHRFIPILAINKGFNAKEIPLQQAEQDTHMRLFGPGVYIRRLLDICTVFFPTKFTQKPLRFFGLLSISISSVGIVISSLTIAKKFFNNQALSEQPLFLVGIIFLLVGLQTFFIGLVAEILIFLHISPEPDYNIEEIVSHEDVSQHKGKTTHKPENRSQPLKAR